MNRSWSRTYGEKISPRHNRDSIEAPHWQHVPTISRYDMSRAGNLGAFQDFVIIRVSDNRLEYARNRRHAKKRHEIGEGFYDLFWSERQLDLEFFRQLFE